MYYIEVEMDGIPVQVVSHTPMYRQVQFWEIVGGDAEGKLRAAKPHLFGCVITFIKERAVPARV